MKKTFTVLFVLIMILSLSACSGNTGDSFNWEDMKLHELLPKPDSNRGEVHTNSERELWVDVSNISEAQYNGYIDACKEKGFTVDAENSSISYEAYNSDGYKLDLTYYKSNKELSINLEAPMEMGTLNWPKSDIAALLPVPESTTGTVEWEASYGFVVYVGNTPIEKFNAYADLCSEMGFSVDYRRGDDYYYADNIDGYHLSLRYEGNNILFVRIDEPDDIEESPVIEESPIIEDPTVTEEPTSSAETSEPPTDEPVNPVDGIRPEFKEAMDSYEAFFDEYIAFMEKYANTTDPTAMLSDYMDFMTRYIEAMEALEAINEDDLSSAELAYYLEVMTRINQKLLSAAY